MSSVYVSLDLGGTNIHCAVGDAEGRVLAEGTAPTQSHLGPQAVIDRMADLSLSLCGGAGVAAAGVGVPGLIDFAGGRTLFLPNLETQWREVAVAERLGARLGCPVRLLNDARMATLGELVFGHGRSVQSMVMFTLGTGIGGGVVIGGRLHLGPLGAAGELGHQTVDPDGPACACGSNGCLEVFASAPALTAEGVRLLRTGQAPKLAALTGGDIARVSPKEMAESGDPACDEAIARAGRWLGIGAANTAVAVHPELIVYAGGMSAIGDPLLNAVRAELDRRIKMFPSSTIRVARSELQDRAGIMGGIALALGKGIG